MAVKKKEKYYKVLIDSKAKAPELRMKKIKLEQLAAKQKTEFEESSAENNGKAAWLMPSGSIFWAAPAIELNNAKKIIFKAGRAAKAKKQAKKTKAKPKARGKAKKKK